MPKQLQSPVLRFPVAALVVGAITVIYFKGIHVEIATVSLTLLLAVLVISAAWGLTYAVFTALLSTLVLDYFFLPPVGTLNITDPQDWVALLAFLVTAIIASRLSERARREAVAANWRRNEIGQLYAFCQRLLFMENMAELLNAIPNFVVETFGVTNVSMLLARSRRIYYSDLAKGAVATEELYAALERDEPVFDSGRGVNIVPVRMGLRSVGVVAMVGGAVSWETVEALGSLIAVAMEHAMAAEKLSKSEAARETEHLRTVLLDSVAHEFRTPLTCIKGAVTSLLYEDLPLGAGQRRDLLTIIDEESDRLNRLIGQAAETAQLEGGQIKLHFEPHDIKEAVDAALDQCELTLKKHPVEVALLPGLPKVQIDVVRIADVLAHFLGNAAKYSAPGSAIHISGEVEDRRLRISVADHGPGLDDFEQPLIFEKFYRGAGLSSKVQGTGMGLAIAKAIVEAHGGTIGVTSQLGHGSVFYCALPLA